MIGFYRFNCLKVVVSGIQPRSQISFRDQEFLEPLDFSIVPKTVIKVIGECSGCRLLEFQQFCLQISDIVDDRCYRRLNLGSGWVGRNFRDWH